MKRSIFTAQLFLVFVGLFCGCTPSSSSYQFNLEGNVRGIANGNVILMKSSFEQDTLLRASIKDGYFKLKGELPEIGVYSLKINDRRNSFYFDGTRMTLDVDYSGQQEWKLTGSPAEDAKAKFQKEWLKDRISPMVDSLQQAFNALNLQDVDQEEYYDKLSGLLESRDIRYNLVRDFVRKYPDNIFSASLSIEEMGWNYDWGKSLYDLLTPRIQKSALGKQLEEKLLKCESIAIGKDMPEFPVETLDGIQQEFTWENGICVIDFWASWCNPCRREIPFLKRLYDEFHDKGVHFVSVSMDKNPARWQQALKEEKLPWLNVRNMDGFEKRGIRSEFHFNGIPYIVLLDKNGKIAAKDIRLKQLREKIIELLGN